MEANKTDNFYKEVFSGFEYKLSGSAFWRKLKWRLFWMDFKYYFVGAGILAITNQKKTLTTKVLKK